MRRWLINDQCGRAQPTVDAGRPTQVALGCIGKLAKQASERHSSMVPASAAG